MKGGEETYKADLINERSGLKPYRSYNDPNGLKKRHDGIIAGLGASGVAKRAARRARNPRTGMIYQGNAKKMPWYAAGKALKATVKVKHRPLYIC